MTVSLARRSALLLLSFVAVAPASAQTDAPLAATAARFEADLADLARIATAAVLVRERTGAFPDSPFALLGAPEAAATLARRFPLSELSVAASGDSLALRYVPLPVAPYVREDLVVTATVRPDSAGTYVVTHEMRRRRDAEDGGAGLLYDRAAEYRVERGFGRLRINVARAQAMVADGTFRDAAFPRMALNANVDDLTLRVHPPGRSEPVFFEASRVTAR